MPRATRHAVASYRHARLRGLIASGCLAVMLLAGGAAYANEPAETTQALPAAPAAQCKNVPFTVIFNQVGEDRRAPLQIEFSGYITLSVGPDGKISGTASKDTLQFKNGVFTTVSVDVYNIVQVDNPDMIALKFTAIPFGPSDKNLYEFTVGGFFDDLLKDCKAKLSGLAVASFSFEVNKQNIQALVPGKEIIRPSYSGTWRVN